MRRVNPVALALAWIDEPEPTPEATFTLGAPEKWHAWNEHDPEVEWCDDIVAAVTSLCMSNPLPVSVIQSGLGGGFLARRLLGCEALGAWIGFEADEVLRQIAFEGVEALPVDSLAFYVSPAISPASPSVGATTTANVTILDSEMAWRCTEIEWWFGVARPGQFLIVHDTDPAASKAAQLYRRALERNLSTRPCLVEWFDNPRGSAMISPK